MNTFDQLPETHIEKIDRLTFERETAERQLKIQVDRDIKVAKEKRKEERVQLWITVAVVAGVVAIAVALIYAWFIDVDPKSPEDYRSTEAGREETCVNNGGGWVPEDLIAVGDKGLCVYPGKVAK